MSTGTPLNSPDSLRLLFGTYDANSTDAQKAHEPPYALMNMLLCNGECSKEAKEKAKLILKVKYWNESDKLKGRKVPNDKTTSDSCGGYENAEPDDVHPCVTDFVISLAAWLREIDCPTGSSVINMEQYNSFLVELKRKTDKDLVDMLSTTPPRRQQHSTAPGSAGHHASRSPGGRILPTFERPGSARLHTPRSMHSIPSTGSRSVERDKISSPTSTDGFGLTERVGNESGGQSGGATDITGILADQQVRHYITQKCFSYSPELRGKCIRDELKKKFRASAGTTYTTLDISPSALVLVQNLHRVSSEFEELKDMFMVLKQDSMDSDSLKYGTTAWGRATLDEISTITPTNAAQYRVNVVKDSGVPVIAKCLKGIVDEGVNVFFTDAKGKVRVVCGCSSDMLYNLFMAVYNGQYNEAKQCNIHSRTYYVTDDKSAKDVIVLCNQDDYKDNVKTAIRDVKPGKSVNELTVDMKVLFVLFHNVEINHETRKSQQLGTLNCSDLFNYQAYFTDVMANANAKNKEVKKQFDREDCKNLFEDDLRPLQFDSKKDAYYFVGSTGAPQYIGKDNCFGFKIDQKNCDGFINCFLTGDNERMSACLKSLLDQDAFAAGFYDLSHVMSPMAHQFFNKLAIQLEAMPNAHGYVQPVTYEQWLRSSIDSKTAYVSGIKNSLSYDATFKPLVNYIKGAISSCRTNPSILNARQQSPASRPKQYVVHPMHLNGNHSTFATQPVFAAMADGWFNPVGAGNGQRGGASSCDNCAASLYNEVRGAIEGLKAKGVVFEDDDKRAIEAGYRQTLKFMEQAEKLKNVMISAINLANQHGIQCKETKTLSKSVGVGKPLSAFKQELESTIHDCKEYGARAGNLAQSCHAHLLATLRNKDMMGSF